MLHPFLIVESISLLLNKSHTSCLCKPAMKLKSELQMSIGRRIFARTHLASCKVTAEISEIDGM